MQTLTTQSEINLAADISIGQLSSPSSKNWNSIVDGLLLDGIYKGGQVKPDSGLRVVLEPFIARVATKTIRITGDAWVSVTFPSYGEYFVVAEVDQDSRLQDYLLVKAIPTASYDSDTMMVFAKVTIPRQSTQISESMIDTASHTVRRSLNPDDLLGKVKSGRGQFKVNPVIPHDLGHQRYSVFIQPEIDDGSVGAVSYTKENSKSVVTNAGTSTGYFSWMILVDTTAVIAEGSVYGQTMVTAAESELRHNLNNANYFPVLTPFEEHTGACWVTKDKNFFTAQSATEGFRALWAAVPITANLITGIASFTDKEIVHGIGTTDYKFFWVSMSPNVPNDLPKFTYENNRVLVESASSGIFQYLIVRDSLALNGKLVAGTSLDHQLNRDDYIVLASNKDSKPFALSMTKNAVFLTEGTDVDVSIIPASSTWVLGDWTRPAPSPRTHRIEFSGFAGSSNSRGSTVLYQLCTQRNIIRKSVAQILPATPIGKAVSLEFYVNDKLKSTMTIAGDATATSQNMAPIAVNVGDIIKVVMLTDPPKSTIAFSWYGNGEVQADSDLEMLEPENAPAFSIIRERVPTWPGLTGDVTVPTYLVGTNVMSLSLNGEDVYITKDYTEKDETTVNFKNIVFKENDYLEVTIFKGEHPQSSQYLNGRPLTAEEAEFLHWAKGQIETIRDWIAAGCPGINISREEIEALKYLTIDIIGNVVGNVTGSAGSLVGLNLTGAKLQEIMGQLTSKDDTDLHFHKSDRDRANHTGKQKLETISDAGNAASKDVTSAMEPNKVLMADKDGRVIGLVHDDEVGSAASKDVGTNAGNVPMLDSSGKLPVTVLPNRDIDDYEIGYLAGNIPYLDEEAKLPKSVLPVTDIAYMETGIIAGTVPVYDEKGKLHNTLTKDDVGTAAKKDAGDKAGNVPVLDDNGKLPIKLIADLGTAAKKDTGDKAGNIPVLNSAGKIDAALIDMEGINQNLEIHTGTKPGEIPVYDEKGKLFNTLSEEDVGTAASKDVGTAAGNIPELNANGKLPITLIADLGNAAKRDVDVANGVAGLNERGKIDYSMLENAPDQLDITFGSEPGNVPKYDDNGKLANTVAPKDLGTAAKKNIGTDAGQVPELDSKGKILKVLLPLTEKSAAYYEVGSAENNIPLLDSTGKLPVSVIPASDNDFVVGTDPGNIVAVNAEGKIESSLLPDFKTGAFRDVGKQPLGLLAFDDKGDYPADIMLKSQLGTAATENVGDEEGMIPKLTTDGLMDLNSLIAAEEATDLNFFADEFLDNVDGLGAIAALRIADARRYVQRANVVNIAAGKGDLIRGQLNFIDNSAITTAVTLDLNALLVPVAGETLTLAFSKASRLPTYPITLGDTFNKFMGVRDKLQLDDANLSGEIKLIYISEAYGWHVIYPNLA
ncbi:hypothetical protein [Yersinia ruckeri]|uniref:hypothetical protein n=1 Tax=Yersinia ruckeri TaxID=29486 RepID=UPI002236F1FA|nr:hypothetical protein [Yersinia ruckeri]MCW6598686.1 hypothetical protein [Yersinia ruckeri]